MKRCIGIVLLLFHFTGFTQVWRVLPNSPLSASFRHDDLYFINPDTGWVCNVDGNIYETTDAGATWKKQISMPNTSFRCIGFINAMKGWAGNLGIGRWSPTVDTLPLYETKDGGNTWQPVLNISGPLPQGICGINVVNDSVVYAVGRVGGPAYLLKTTNAGASWKSTDMSAIAFQLIDCKFFSPDTGFVIGGFPAPDSLSRTKILYTTNGGINWTAVTSGVDTGFHCWKIFFVNRQLGYVSIENNVKGDTVYFLKTMDGGLSWKKSSYFKSQSWGGQGIGFVNDTLGWCAFLSGDTKQTSDGGKTWTDANAILNSLNRMRVINPNLAYAVGNKVWKYSLYATGIEQAVQMIPAKLSLSCFPNPFKEKITIQYRIPFAGKVDIRLYDFSGRPVKIIHDAIDAAGEHRLDLVISYYFDTHFFVVLKFEQYQITQRIISGN
ncbi:MAG: hypothetical protein ACHQK8_00750 [Bacteroidia bacterium]